MSAEISKLDIHPRSLKRNIWRGLLCASDQEIHEGMHFYEGAYGLCRFFSRAHPDVSPSQVAGIYSALSPMNTWDTNVSNILEVLRDGTAASVNTTDINLHKALQIRVGAAPLDVLQGRKVRAFYRAISEPEDTTHVPVDRHLINLALGVFPDKNMQSRLASDRDIYTGVENAYLDLGRREISFPLSIVQRAPIVYLPRNHPHRNSAGWQYLSRHVVMEITGEKLRRDEHVHHDNRDKTDCRAENLKVMLAEHHGRHHASYQLLYMLRDRLGRWAPSEIPRTVDEKADEIFF